MTDTILYIIAGAELIVLFGLILFYPLKQSREPHG